MNRLHEALVSSIFVSGILGAKKCRLISNGLLLGSTTYWIHKSADKVTLQTKFLCSQHGGSHMIGLVIPNGNDVSVALIHCI